MPKLNLAHIHLHQQSDGTREICVAPEYLAHGAQAAYYQARDPPPLPCASPPPFCRLSSGSLKTKAPKT